MKKCAALSRSLIVMLAFVLLGASGGGAASATGAPVTDTYFGTAVIDPYRYMETDGPAFSAWKAKESAATQALLAKAHAQAGPDATGAAIPRITDLAVANHKAFFARHSATSDELIERDLNSGAEHTVVTDKL